MYSDKCTVFLCVCVCVCVCVCIYIYVCVCVNKILYLTFRRHILENEDGSLEQAFVCNRIANYTYCDIFIRVLY